MRITLNSMILLLALASGAPLAWAAPASPGSITVGPAGITYFARAGDTLSSIAQQLTARPENWQALGKLNQITKESNIPIGAAILIPAELLADEPSEASVTAWSGTIMLERPDGTAAVIGLGSKLSEGMLIDTGNNSFLTISLPDASRISLPSNSRVKLAKLRVTRYTKSPRTEVMLLRGRVESQVSPLESNKGRFEVHSPRSVAGVRGTHFRVRMVGDGIANEVLSGSVAVGRDKQPASLMLAAGKGNIIDASSVGAAVDLLPAPQLAGSGTQANHPSAKFALTPAAGAHGYHLQIATDPKAQNILAESVSTDSSMKLPDIEDGDYFVRVSAIDKYGLEGLAETHAVTLKGRAGKAAAPGAPFVADSGDKNITLRWPAQSGQKFMLQVARVPDFTWLLFTNHTAMPEARLPRPAFGTYYARVQTVNADGSASPYSPASSFIVTDQWVINDATPASVQEIRSGAPR